MGDLTSVLYVGRGTWLAIVAAALEEICRVEWRRTADEAFSCLSERWSGVVLYEAGPSWEDIGTELETLKSHCDDAPVVVAIGSESTLEMEREIRKVGVFYYLIAPPDVTELREVVRSAIVFYRRRHYRFEAPVDDAEIPDPSSITRSVAQRSITHPGTGPAAADSHA